MVRESGEVTYQETQEDGYVALGFYLRCTYLFVYQLLTSTLK